MYQTVAISERGRDASLVRFGLWRIGLPAISLPLIGFFFTVLWSFFFNFRASTGTHCRVANYLPSISAAIVYPPSSYVWRLCIALDSVPRFFITAMYYSINRRRRMDQTSKLALYQGVIAKILAILNFFELVGLLLLTIISSQDNKSIHVFSFVCFTVGGSLYMMLTCFFHSAMSNETELEWKSLRRKKICCIFYFISLILAVYFYYRHNKYCEKGVYTLFALFEYILVLSNIGFHYTLKYDFASYTVRVDPTDVKLP